MASCAFPFNILCLTWCSSFQLLDRHRRIRSHDQIHFLHHHHTIFGILRFPVARPPHHPYVGTWYLDAVLGALRETAMCVFWTHHREYCWWYWNSYCYRQRFATFSVLTIQNFVVPLEKKIKWWLTVDDRWISCTGICCWWKAGLVAQPGGSIPCPITWSEPHLRLYRGSLLYPLG